MGNRLCACTDVRSGPRVAYKTRIASGGVLAIPSPDSTERLQACGDLALLHAEHTADPKTWDDPLDPGPERTTIGELCKVCTRNAVCHRVRRHLVARGVVNVDRLRVDDCRLRSQSVERTRIDQLLALAQLYRDAKQRVLTNSVSTNNKNDPKRYTRDPGKKSLSFARFMTTWSREYMDPASEFAAL